MPHSYTHYPVKCSFPPLEKYVGYLITIYSITIPKQKTVTYNERKTICPIICMLFAH